MSRKVQLLSAVRDELKAAVPEVHGRVFVVVQDAQGQQVLPKEAACPFLTVADAGLDPTSETGLPGMVTHRVAVRVHVQDVRDCEAPVIGHDASGSVGAADFQDRIAAALGDNVLAARIADVALAVVERLPAVDYLADEGWFAVIGDVAMRYELAA